MATATMARSAFGLDSGPDADWKRFAACTYQSHTEYPKVSGQHGFNNHPAARARHVCMAHCPVLADCAAWTKQLVAENLTPVGMVQAGLVWADTIDSRRGPVKQQPDDPGCGPHCAHLRGIRRT